MHARPNTKKPTLLAANGGLVASPMLVAACMLEGGLWGAGCSRHGMDAPPSPMLATPAQRDTAKTLECGGVDADELRVEVEEEAELRQRDRENELRPLKACGAFHGHAPETLRQPAARVRPAKTKQKCRTHKEGRRPAHSGTLRACKSMAPAASDVRMSDLLAESWEAARASRAASGLLNSLQPRAIASACA